MKEEKVSKNVAPMAPEAQASEATASKAQSDVIRVAPLHHPKPNLDLEEIKKKKDADSELFDGHQQTPPANAHLSYRGGPLIANCEVFTIFWGNNWHAKPAFVTLAQKINRFFAAILVSPLIDQLAEYNVHGKPPIGHGKLIGTKTITVGAPTTSVTDTHIRAEISAWITTHQIPSPTPNTLYFVYTDLGVKVIMGGSASCTAFCGYHSDIAGHTWYAVMPFPGCAGCLGGLSALDALTGTSSHELCEAITDPIPGKSWYDNNNGEIGDICAWTFKHVAGYNVQKEWSNNAHACI